MSRKNRFAATLIAGVIACSVSGRLAGQGPGTDTPKPNTRITYTPHYGLSITGAYYAGQGFRIASVEANSPATRLVKPGDPNSHGSLHPGDLITRVDGQQVDSLQSFYDLLKAGAVNRGKVVIRVHEMWTGKPIDWEATPVGGPGPGPDQGPGPDAGPGPFQPPASGMRRLHVLLIALTGDPDLRDAQNLNLQGMDHLIHSQVPARKLASCRTLRDQDVTAERILDAVDGVQLGRGDTLFVYYGGHGAFDPQRAEGDPAGGHHFQIPGGDLMRKTLMKHMLDKGARLTVLISDTCNVKSQANVLLPIRPEAPLPPPGPPPQIKPTALEILLLQHRGVVDICASSRGQYSWSNGHYGGWFTHVACDVFCDEECSAWNVAMERLSAQSNGFYHELRQRALGDPGSNGSEILQSLRNQPDMIPQAFQLNVRRELVAKEPE